VQFPPESKDWFYEVKFDGYRCLAGRDQNGVTLWFRRSNLFTAQFPRIAQACESLPAGTLLDGEVVAIDNNGRILFNLLRTTAPRPRRFSSMSSACCSTEAGACSMCRSKNSASY
jgi:ATP-dependent DNA ligase